MVRDVEEVTAAVGEEASEGDPLGVPQHLIVVVVVRPLFFSNKIYKRSQLHSVWLIKNAIKVRLDPISVSVFCFS